MINKRIYDLSCNEDQFNKAKPLYENALKESGYIRSTVYASSHESSNRNRNRKIIWFNPPFSQNVKINIGNIFIKLTKKYFPKDSKLLKIFNTSTIKLSYSCMPNMSSVIKQLDENYFHHHKPTENVNVTAEIQPAAHSTVNVLLKTLFIKRLFQQSPILIHITVVVKISSFTITTIQKHFATNIIKFIQNFLNIYRTLKTQEFIITSPGVFLLMPQHTDVVQ